MVRDGYIYGLSLLAVAIALAWATHDWAWGIVPVLLAAFFLWFFRDPERTIPTGPGLIVSPGDGLVTETASIATPEGPRQRISIFLSVFDVHVNRSPIGGVLTSVRYQKGQYLNAMNPASAERNEQNMVTVRGEDGVEVTFKQIAGLLARRIVFQLARGRHGGAWAARGPHQVRLPRGCAAAGRGGIARESGSARKRRRERAGGNDGAADRASCVNCESIHERQRAFQQVDGGRS